MVLHHIFLFPPKQVPAKCWACNQRTLSVQTSTVDAARHFCVLQYSQESEPSKNIWSFVVLHTKTEKHGSSSVLSNEQMWV